jgi:hypothetical protein
MNMENKQTAIEWLAEKVGHNSLMSLADYNEILEQAIAMEKEQIVKAVYDSMGTNFDPNMGRAELYYNETYGKGNI